MAKVEYWQRGESLDFANENSAKIEANSVIVIGDKIGVAGMDIAPRETGSIHITGVFRFPKTTVSEAIAVGTAVYFDGTGIVAASGSGTTAAGWVVAASGASDTTVLVKIND